MDFLCFYFPLFCIHWLMGNHLLELQRGFPERISAEPLARSHELGNRIRLALWKTDNLGKW